MNWSGNGGTAAEICGAAGQEQGGQGVRGLSALGRICSAGRGLDEKVTGELPARPAQAGALEKAGGHGRVDHCSAVRRGGHRHRQPQGAGEPVQPGLRAVQPGACDDGVVLEKPEGWESRVLSHVGTQGFHIEDVSQTDSLQAITLLNNATNKRIWFYIAKNEKRRISQHREITRNRNHSFWRKKKKPI